MPVADNATSDFPTFTITVNDVRVPEQRKPFMFTDDVFIDDPHLGILPPDCPLRTGHGIRRERRRVGPEELHRLPGTREAAERHNDDDGQQQRCA